MNVFLLKLDFFTTKKDGSNGPTALESHGTMTRVPINLKAWIGKKFHLLKKLLPVLKNDSKKKYCQIG